MAIYDSQQRAVKVGDKIGEGGEALLFQVAGQSQAWVAKIYKVPPTEGYEQKLAWMLAHPPDDPTRKLAHASIAWPTELLYDAGGQLVGYLMPYVKDAFTLLHAFNPTLRKRILPGFNRLYLHRTARNLAAALAVLHASEYVVGDLNEGNIMVTPSALVTLIDTDSFQVLERSGARVTFYPCPVGKPEYTPRELYGTDFKGRQRYPEHDHFGLGVLIFQLLMDGSHPFRARWLGKGEPDSLEERIRQGCFPYMSAPPCPVEPPANTPQLESLHPKLSQLVRRCFIEGHQEPRQRPSASEWRDAIGKAEKALIQCDKGHYYGNHLSACPSCHPIRQARKRTKGSTQPSPIKRLKQSTLLSCPLCFHHNQTEEIYCQNCLHQLRPNKQCPHCKHGTPETSHYCVGCGRQL